MGRKYRYDIMCAIGAYNKQQPPTEPDYSISGCGRPLPSTSSTQALTSLGNTLHFIYQCLQWFGSNYSTITLLYRKKMWDPINLPVKNIDENMKNYQTEIKAVGGAWLIEKKKNNLYQLKYEG